MVRLDPMTETEFRVYLEDDIQRYAQAQVRAGNWHPTEAMEKSRKEHQQLLPDGLASKNQHLFSIMDEELGCQVGVIWFAVYDEGLRPSVFIYDFLIHDDFRRRGYGTQALEALEDKVKELGIDRISLHVFGYNQIAQALYRKLGYEIAGMHMTKQLEPSTL